MRTFILFLILSGLFPKLVFSQANCSSPMQIDICPTTYLTHQSNAGMIDDAPSSINIPGEDRVYEIISPSGANQIFVTVFNSTGSMKLTLNSGNCSGATSSSRFALPGTSIFTFNVLNTYTVYYLWVDATNTITYDISIGGDTAMHYLNIPNTIGNMTFDSCAMNAFKSNKPFFEVQYNNNYMHDPMTLAPLFSHGTMCISVYLKNLTGTEGAERISFDFDSTGYSSVISLNDTMAGSYNAGNWILHPGIVGDHFEFDFNDSAGIHRGDFTGNPNACLKYEFCFDIIPISNDPVKTNVNIHITGDAYGTGFTGWVVSGCCPVGSLNCLGNFGPGPGSGAATGLGFSFGDPGGSSLPIHLKDFYARAYQGKVLLKWSTASEINNDHFTIERSADGIEWTEILKVKGSGNSNFNRYYSAEDISPLNGSSFYRLKQTDYDGVSETFSPVSVINDEGSFRIYPNPASGIVMINLPDKSSYFIYLENIFGERIFFQKYIAEDRIKLNVTEIPAGFYFLHVSMNDEVVFTEKIIVRH